MSPQWLNWLRDRTELNWSPSSLPWLQHAQHSKSTVFVGMEVEYFQIPVWASKSIFYFIVTHSSLNLENDGMCGPAVTDRGNPAESMCECFHCHCQTWIITINCELTGWHCLHVWWLDLSLSWVQEPRSHSDAQSSWTIRMSPIKLQVFLKYVTTDQEIKYWLSWQINKCMIWGTPSQCCGSLRTHTFALWGL